MKVLLVNGSPHPAGVNNRALNEMKKVFEENGIEVNLFHVGNKNVRGCTACNYCAKNGKCVFDDAVNKAASYFEEADGIVVSSPVYFASPNATLLAFLDRLFYSTHFDKTMKLGASVVTGRRGGMSATYDVLNKYFGVSGMPIVTGQYWNSVHGLNSEEAEKDEEGLQSLRTLAQNFSFLMKSIKLGKEKYNLPKKEEPIYTNFVKN